MPVSAKNQTNKLNLGQYSDFGKIVKPPGMIKEEDNEV